MSPSVLNPIAVCISPAGKKEFYYDKISAMKIGDALIKEGKITRDQLKLALDRQVVFGGRIGTNIIELRIISEREMMELLSKFYRVPSVDVAQINNIDEDVINCITPAIADKYKVLPFRKDRTRLHVAMLNPRAFSEMEDLRFLTGFDVLPYAISELRLLFCLEKYYGLKRDMRYISIFEEEDGSRIADHEAYIMNIREQFATVKDKDDVGKIILNETKPYAKRIAMFMLRGEQIIGWKGREITVDGFSVIPEAGSVFLEAQKLNGPYKGPLQNNSGNAPLISRLGGAPSECCVIPVMMKGKLVAFIYADNEGDAVQDSGANFISRLAAMAEPSFEMTLIRQRIFSL
ncbi:MAG: hypothetical protein C0402_01695 [Thermodesulfovibrio sp.]|nr:hypothetical protein [Thermodesulfovibrio sp.]